MPLQALPEVTRPFERVGLDIVSFKESVGKQTCVLTMIDHFSRYLVMIPLINQSAESVAKAFMSEWVLRFGLPKSVITDRGANFMSELFLNLCKFLGIKKLSTTAYHPECNDRTERVHRTISKMLSYYVSGNHKD